MISDISVFEERLHGLDPDVHDFVLRIDKLIADLDPKLGSAVTPVVFRFFENHPTSDMGAPGTLVHYLESFFPSYVELLKSSALLRPSYNSILMINRILNSSDCPTPDRMEYLGILDTIAKNDQLDDDLRDLADRFHRRHVLPL
jgi:hypothetical protein